MFIAIATGIFTGGFVGLWCTSRTVRWAQARCGIAWLASAAPCVAAAIAALPAFFLAFVVGGNMGGGIGSAALGALGAAVGLAVGIGLVLALGVALAACIGALLAAGVCKLLGRRPNNSSKPTPLRGAA